MSALALSYCVDDKLTVHVVGRGMSTFTTDINGHNSDMECRKLSPVTSAKQFVRPRRTLICARKPNSYFKTAAGEVKSIMAGLVQLFTRGTCAQSVRRYPLVSMHPFHLSFTSELYYQWPPFPTWLTTIADIEELYRYGENTQKGIVLFVSCHLNPGFALPPHLHDFQMPFLHWETDRRRNQAANLIEQLADEHDLDKRETAMMWKTKRKEDRDALRRALTNASLPVHPIQTDDEDPDYYRPRGTNREKILKCLAKILWDRIGEGKDMPSGLTYALWKNIRDESCDKQLLLALEKAIVDRLSSGPAALMAILPETTLPSTVPSPGNGGQIERSDDPILLIFFEKIETGSATPGAKTTTLGKLRDWKDILWEIKEAGRGHPTPHALEDIFWGEIKRVRQHESFFKHDTAIFRGVDMDEHKHLQPGNSLAQVLVRAARLYEQMKTYPDQRIMEEYLFKHPPLHPRRTLDQAYFWRLRNTRVRDRDQVVYRYTNAEFAHDFRPQSPSDVKNDRSRSSLTDKLMIFKRDKAAKKENWAWTRHGEYESKNGCEQCEEDIRKVPRAIMVDQLWMWVLDKDTILTCFPQRYGMSEKDPSGVHQSIRLRIKARSNPDNHVLSIFDLALIILDECFDTFFNRTRTPDKRPQVMDMFAESIGRVVSPQLVHLHCTLGLSQPLINIPRPTNKLSLSNIYGSCPNTSQ